MSTLTDEAKRVKKLHKSYNDARKRITAAMAECSIGTAVYLQYSKALQELDTKERAEEISLGLTPANLGAMITTEFVYVAHCPVIPSNKAELEKLLGKQLRKASEGLCYSDAEEAIKADLQTEFR
jgi:hypothetical protein